MVLPLLGSFLGSALLPGMFGGTLGTVAAGAIGSGLGSLAQGDSFDEAVTTGLTSFMGGKLLGGLGKEFTKLGEGASSADKLAGMVNPKLASQAGVEAAKLSGEGALKNALTSGLGIAKDNPFTAAGLAGGTLMGQAANQPLPQEDKTPYQRTETVPINPTLQQPAQGYIAGVDPQHRYGFLNPSASEYRTQVLQKGGLAELYKYAEGGATPEAQAEEPNEKDIIVNAVNAVKGNMSEDQAKIALGMFIQVYGEAALEDLVEDVRAGEYDNLNGKMDGQVPGGGDGMSDSVPATIDGKGDLLASKDEYMIDAPTVAMIGNGSSDAGAKKLDKMREDVRKAATGSSMQPKQIDAERIMSKAIS